MEEQVNGKLISIDFFIPKYKRKPHNCFTEVSEGEYKKYVESIKDVSEFCRYIYKEFYSDKKSKELCHKTLPDRDWDDPKTFVNKYFINTCSIKHRKGKQKVGTIKKIECQQEDSITFEIQEEVYVDNIKSCTIDMSREALNNICYENNNNIKRGVCVL